jgi:hypothetical protein
MKKRFIKYKTYPDESGMMLAAILMISIFLSVLAFAIINFSTVNLSRARSRVLLLQAQYASESGADATLAILNSGNSSYSGTASDVQLLDNSPYYKATYSITVTSGSTDKQKYITSTGKIYVPSNAATPKYTRKIEIYSERSTTSFSSSAVSRNILYIESGVKNLNAKDLTINGFIQMNKNTTNLIAENIVIGGKNTGAGNCSIGGSGNLVKPTSFTTAGQTKTNITMAYNNCISPPGNSSNSDFSVSANQAGISQVQSTFIPWSQYMDNTYQNSPGGCSDWTSGTFPRDIPSTGNTKKTHYPNSSSGIDTSGTCGTAGNLNLSTGQYNIKDNVHIRANLCGTAGCTPTFNNPDSTLKWVFVEGTINFNSLNTTAGSGPIVFVAYGADPAGLSATCPYGGSAYLGNSGNTSAPKIYILALNGICLDKTKFSSANALGGLSGKNIYISTNPGTPFDLGLDPAFPTSQIPVDLSWKSVRYRRLSNN